MKVLKNKYFIMLELTLALSLAGIFVWQNQTNTTIYTILQENQSASEDNYIKWVDFDVTYEALEQAYSYDLNSQADKVVLDWIELLAYLGAKYGGDFTSNYKAADMDELAALLQSKDETMESLTKGMTYYDYYYEAYSAVLGGLVGEYEIEVPATSEDPESEETVSEKEWTTTYGLKAFSPIAKNFPYSDYDDFGVSRSYGYQRQHLGHDMMGQVGTPVIAVESGYVEALGWNQYGGWRIGIRSFDGKRYYYYAHLRKGFPYHLSLEEGSVVQAGDVIGYLGRTGYSTTEDTNNIDTAHLHFGLQLIFDESQKEGNNEIWIDCYSLVRFLYQNRSETVKNETTKDYSRIYEIRDPAVIEWESRQKSNESQ